MSLESLKIQGECRKREREEQTDVNRKGIKSWLTLSYYIKFKWSK